MSGAEYHHVALKGQSWKLRPANTIDECMKYAADRDAFLLSLMVSEVYAVRWEGTRKCHHSTLRVGRHEMPRQQNYTKKSIARRPWSMNSESEQRLSLQELKQRNSPADSAAGAATTSRSAPHESGLGANVMNDLDTLWYHAGSAADSLLESVSRQMSQLPTRTRAGRSAEDGAASGQMTEQVGKPKENSFSLHRIRLPRLHLPTCQYSGIDLC